MFARYAFNKNTPLNDIQADLVSMLTGVTDPGLLVACDSARSEINVTANPAGWEVYDAVAPGKTALRAPISDVPGSYKYLFIDSVSTADYIRFTSYTDWDNVAHVGINPSYQTANYIYTNINITATTSGFIYITASANHAIFYLNNGATWNGPYGITERSRRGEWDTPENNFPNFGCFYSCYADMGAGGLSQPLTYNPTANIVEISIINSLRTIWGDAGYLYPSSVTITRNEKLSSSYQLYDLSAVEISRQHIGGSISEKADVWIGTLNVTYPEDTFVSGTDVYIQLGKGTNALIVRYG